MPGEFHSVPYFRMKYTTGFCSTLLFVPYHCFVSTTISLGETLSPLLVRYLRIKYTTGFCSTLLSVP